MRMKVWAVAGVALALPAVCGALSMSFAPSMLDRARNVAAPVPQPVDPFAGQLVADAELAELRGGFEAQSGLRVNFGIERVVVVNGQMMATTAFNVVTDAAMLQGGGLRVFSGGAAVSESVPVNLGLIQIGPNNVAGINPGQIAGTVIQNSLDHQNIQHITTINATVNAASLMRANRFNEAMRDAMVGAMRR